MVDPDITVGDWVYVQRRNIPGVPLKEGGRGKVPPRGPRYLRAVCLRAANRDYCGVGRGGILLMQWQVTNASRDSNGRLVLDVKYVLTPSVYGSSQWYRTRKPRCLYGESVTATAWPHFLELELLHKSAGKFCVAACSQVRGARADGKRHCLHSRSREILEQDQNEYTLSPTPHLHRDWAHP